MLSSSVLDSLFNLEKNGINKRHTSPNISTITFDEAENIHFQQKDDDLFLYQKLPRKAPRAPQMHHFPTSLVTHMLLLLWFSNHSGLGSICLSLLRLLQQNIVQFFVRLHQFAARAAA